MADRKTATPEIHWRQLQATREARELFRYERRGEMLIYRLCLTADGEYEVSVTERTGTEEVSSGAMRFTHPDTYMSFLHDVEKNLVRDGWTAATAPVE